MRLKKQLFITIVHTLHNSGGIYQPRNYETNIFHTILLTMWSSAHYCSSHLFTANVIFLFCTTTNVKIDCNLDKCYKLDNLMGKVL